MTARPAKMLHLVVRTPDGAIQAIPLTEQMLVPAKPGAQYALIDPATGRSPQGLQVKRKGNSLVIEQDDDSDLLEISDFYDEPETAFIPQAELDGSALSGTAVTATTPPLETTANGETLIWNGTSDDGGLFTPVNLGLGGLAVGAGIAASGGGGGGGATVVNTVAGTIVGGPVIDGNDLRVEIFQADGVTKLGEAQVNADGSFSITVGSYIGVVIARVVNDGASADYLDEATQSGKDLNAELFAVEVISEPNSTITVNLNVLTTLAYHKAQELAADAALSPEDAEAINQAIADLFGLPSLHGITVVPTNGGHYDDTDGLSAEEVYGAILAALSGADALNGGDSQKTIDNLLAGLTISDGTASLSESAQATVVQGAEHTSTQTGQDLTGDIAAVMDTHAPDFVSGGLAPALDENSGTGRVVYTAVANDATGIVTYSLKPGTDAALFSIDASTGAVTLIGNPDYESQSSYSFTVIATDAAGNASEQAVSLDINNLDEVAPTITSGATATTIDENSGAGQLVYTAASTDTGDISTGNTLYSLKAVDDHAAFSIDASTGEVTLIGNPDYEGKPSYSFTVVATDAAGNASEQVITLDIGNLDEVAPTITSAATAAAIDENSGAGQVVYTITSTDTGDIATGDTRYSLKTGDDAALFSIDANTGAVTLIGNPDYESKASYSFTVVATDAAGNACEQTVSLDINNLDEVAPTITSGATATTINENSGAGQLVYTAASTDTGDIATGNTRYSLKEGDDAVLFSIDANTGAVTLIGNPDYESKASYNFTVVATDAAGNASEQQVTLDINNLDEVAPTITSGATAMNVDENSGAGQLVYTAASTDTGDISTGNTLYSLKAVDDHAAFSIDASTGEVSLIGNPDFESQASYSFTVVATDAAGNASEQQVTLDINNLDEVAPTITSAATAAAIDENSGEGQVVYTVTSTDTDDVSTGNTLYSLKAVDDHAAFNIDASTGEVSLIGNPDFEGKPSYSFTVVATDAAGNASEQVVTLDINNLDEVAPTITSAATAAAIDENSGAGQVIYTVTSTDNGDIATGSTRYSLKTGDDAALFNIDENTGAVTLIGNPDYEGQSSYSFTVVATDAAGNASEQAVTLDINNLDEVAPTITSATTAAAIDENSGEGQVVYTVTSTDTGDIATGSTTYSLKETGDHTAFSIDASTGEVTLIGNPDYESQSSYSFTVVATDDAGNASEQAVTLDINNLDEVAPTITSAATAASIDENSGAGQLVYTAASTDSGDISTGNTLYSLKAVDDHAAFSIDATTGQVSLIGNPDFESQASYSFTVVATDTAGNASEQEVTLDINNLDEIAPLITSGAMAPAIDENSGAGQVVYTVVSTDTGDIATGSTTYSLKETNDHTAFSIDVHTGEVTLVGNPDFEGKSSYSFTVVATDTAGNASEQAVTLDINNLDEVAPTITSATTAAAIDENSGEGQVVYTVTSTDTGDIATGSTTYSLKETGDHTAFSIDASTGEVTLIGNPDYESQSSYSFTVVATDDAGNASEQAVTLDINNLDEVAPTITSAATAASIDENSGEGQVVYTVTSTDTGDISAGSTTYSLKEAGDHAAFNIDTSTGEVTLIGNPDYESQSSYSFTVIATDDAGNASEQAVTLDINNLDEVAPSITSGALATAIDENSGEGQVVYTVTSTDTGDISTGSTTYSLKETGDHAAFNIDTSTGEVTLIGNPDYETKPSYNFTVIATDAAGNASEQPVTLNINDLDEIPPTVSLVVSSQIKLEPADQPYGNDQQPQITAIGSDGAFVVTWQGQDANGGYSIFVQRFDQRGTPVGIPQALESTDNTSGHDQQPQITAIGSDGAFVVTWQGQDADGDYSIFVQRFDQSGVPIGVPQLLEPADNTSGHDQEPQVTALGSDGAFVVTWSGQAVGGNQSIFVQRFDQNGAPMGEPQSLNGILGYGHYYAPQVTTLGTDGAFVVAWSGQTVDIFGYQNVYVQRFDQSGPPVGEPQLLQPTDQVNGNNYSPQVTEIGTEGAFVVTWSGQTAGSFGYQQIYVQRFDQNGTPVGEPQLLEPADRITGHDHSPQVTAIGTDGAFVVTWYGTDADGDYSIFLQRFDQNGAPAGEPLLLEPADNISGHDQSPQVTALGTDGAYVVTWFGQDANGYYSIFVQGFDQNGTPVGEPQLLQSEDRANGVNFRPQVTALGDDGAFVVTWQGQDGDGDYSIYVQRFGTDGQPVTNDTLPPTASITVRSSEPGMVYLVHEDVVVTQLTDITDAVDDLWNSVLITAANSNTALSLAGLADGKYHAYAVDAAGNLSVVSSNYVTVDSIATTPTLTLANDTGTSDSDNVTSDPTINVSGLEEGATWQYRFAAGQQWMNGSGSSFELPDNGTFYLNDIQVRQTDKAGNVSAIGTLGESGTIIIDTAAPFAPGLELANDTGSSDSDGITYHGVVNVIGLQGGATWEYSTNGGNSWIVGSGSSFTLAAASYAAGSILVRQTDTAGNTSLEGGFSDAITVDVSAPTLSSSTPADDATAVAVGANIVLTFSENVFAGNGDILISNGTDTRIIAVTDTSQVTVSGNTVTINPSTDLEAGSNYHVQVASGVFTDHAGNAYAGISDGTTLNFETSAAPPMDTSIVVFDLVQGVSSDHSGRTFDAGTSYTIYVHMHSKQAVFSTAGDGPGTWGMWSGANNLGADDKIVFVGTGQSIQSKTGAGAANWKTVDLMSLGYNGGYGLHFFGLYYSILGPWMFADGSLNRTLAWSINHTTVPIFGNVDLWNGTWVNINAGKTLNQVHMLDMPAGVLTSQGLA